MTTVNIERLPIGTRIEIIENANEHVTPKYSLVGKHGVIVEYAPDDDGAPAYWVDFDESPKAFRRRRPIILSYMVRPL